MQIKDPESFEQQRSSFELALEKHLAGLDRTHYPASLLGNMALVLCPHGRRPLRGLPLLLGCLYEDDIGRNVPAERSLVAAEVLFRGFLLLAELSMEKNLRPATSVACQLEQESGEEHSGAYLLLAADTLFTWPMELASGETDPEGYPLARRFSSVLGANGILGKLDSITPDLNGSCSMFLAQEPVEALVRAVSGKAELPESIYAAARWIYLKELVSWLGVSLGTADDEMQRIKTGLEKETGQAGRLICFLSTPSLDKSHSR